MLQKVSEMCTEKSDTHFCRTLSNQIDELKLDIISYWLKTSKEMHLIFSNINECKAFRISNGSRMRERLKVVT